MDKAPEAFRTISEVADDLDVPQHVLRFWESRFSQIRPMKRGGGRRYYRPDDVALLRGIRYLLYGQGYTIRGVQRILREEGIRFVQTVWEEEEEDEGSVVADVEVAGTERGRPGRVPPGAAETDVEEEFPGSRDERREPTFDMPRPAVPVAAAPVQVGLSASDRDTLQSVLDDLIDCRQVLAGALDRSD